MFVHTVINIVSFAIKTKGLRGKTKKNKLREGAEVCQMYVIFSSSQCKVTLSLSPSLGMTYHSPLTLQAARLFTSMTLKEMLVIHP